MAKSGDSGKITKGKGVFEVSNTQKVGKVILHEGKVKTGSLKKNTSVTAAIDSVRRLSVARNHTATHLLQAALRKVLGAHVKQQGSLVAADRLRFDFTHFQALGKEEISRIEELVNEYILQNVPLAKKDMPLAKAKKTGALAFFGEKYDTKVTVVSIGELSKELCGGTHLNNTGQIGLFKILQEGSVASGVRRLEAVTGMYAYHVVRKLEGIIKDIGSLFNAPWKTFRRRSKRNSSALKI